jgi:4-diphosphocytidyl-2-C-methyl-D-erythritol kinase
MTQGWYPAPAKLNLFLHVVGRRADGYHLLETVFRFIDYGDRLKFTSRDDNVIIRGGNSPIPPEDDLIVRAARLLQRDTGCQRGVEIVVEKRIPTGAGLGGGSSDAATTLLALNRIWGANFPRSRLLELGLSLGADVPVFLFGESAFAQGVGERLSPFALPPKWYVVLTPPVEVPTREMFSHPQLTRNTNRLKMSAFSIEDGHNDLEPVACRRYPVIANYLAWLNDFARARMSGSGSAVFAAFEKEAEARAVIARLQVGMRGFVARGLDRHPLRDLVE